MITGLDRMIIFAIVIKTKQQHETVNGKWFQEHNGRKWVQVRQAYRLEEWEL